MPRYAIHVLGQERIVCCAGAALDAPSVFWAVLGCLLSAPRRSLSRTRLATQLWPDQPEPAARHCLASALWRIRARLGLPIVSTSGDMVMFVAGSGMWMDLIAFERRAQPAAAQPALLDARRHRQRLDRALGLYCGDFLSEIDQEDIAVERARLRALYLDAMYALSRSQARAGDWEDALRTARTLCAAEPLREDAQRLLIEAYARCGNCGLALRQFQICQAVLARELEVEPMAATIALRARVLDGLGDPAHPPDAPVDPHRAALILTRQRLRRTLRTLDQTLGAD